MSIICIGTTLLGKDHAAISRYMYMAVASEANWKEMGARLTVYQTFLISLKKMVKWLSL